MAVLPSHRLTQRNWVQSKSPLHFGDPAKLMLKRLDIGRTRNHMTLIRNGLMTRSAELREIDMGVSHKDTPELNARETRGHTEGI